MPKFVSHLRAVSLALAAAIAVALAGFSFEASAASPQQSVRSDGSYQIALRGNDRVCCKRGWQDWWSTWRQCRRSGGHVVRNQQCRNDWNERWDSRWFGWNGGNWNNRVCCKRGKRDWWTSARECRESFGWITSNRQCRNDHRN